MENKVKIHNQQCNDYNKRAVFGLQPRENGLVSGVMRWHCACEIPILKTDDKYLLKKITQEMLDKNVDKPIIQQKIDFQLLKKQINHNEINENIVYVRDFSFLLDNTILDFYHINLTDNFISETKSIRVEIIEIKQKFNVDKHLQNLAVIIAIVMFIWFIMGITGKL